MRDNNSLKQEVFKIIPEAFKKILDFFLENNDNYFIDVFFTLTITYYLKGKEEKKIYIRRYNRAFAI